MAQFIAKLFLIGAILLASSSPVAAIDLVTTAGEADHLNSSVQSDGWTLVMLWAHDCIPCERQKPLIEKFYKRNKTRGLNVLGVSTDAKAIREKAVETYRSTKTSFTNYYFEGANFSTSYLELTGHQFLGTPTYMVYDPNGQLRGIHTGTLTREMLDKQFRNVLKEPQFAPSADLLR